jgi:hypothetical protein
MRGDVLIEFTPIVRNEYFGLELTPEKVVSHFGYLTNGEVEQHRSRIADE